jgi:hypothetical protein
MLEATQNPPAKETITVTTQLIAPLQVAAPGDTHAAQAFARIKVLTGCYLAISALAVAATAAMQHHHAEVNSAVWSHGIGVAVSSLVMFTCAILSARGVRGAYRRLRIASVVIVVAIAVIIALPGSFPLWMKAEQGLAGLCMIGVAVLANSRPVRAAFAR